MCVSCWSLALAQGCCNYIELRWDSESVLGMQLLFLLWLVIEDHDNLFIMAEVVHFLGIGVLIYKLWTKKNAGGEAIRMTPSSVPCSCWWLTAMSTLLFGKARQEGGLCRAFNDAVHLQVSLCAHRS